MTWCWLRCCDSCSSSFMLPLSSLQLPSITKHWMEYWAAPQKSGPYRSSKVVDQADSCSSIPPPEGGFFSSRRFESDKRIQNWHVVTLGEEGALVRTERRHAPGCADRRPALMTVAPPATWQPSGCERRRQQKTQTLSNRKESSVWACSVGPTTI